MNTFIPLHLLHEEDRADVIAMIYTIIEVVNRFGVLPVSKIEKICYFVFSARFDEKEMAHQMRITARALHELRHDNPPGVSFGTDGVEFIYPCLPKCGDIGTYARDSFKERRADLAERIEKNPLDFKSAPRELYTWGWHRFGKYEHPQVATGALYEGAHVTAPNPEYPDQKIEGILIGRENGHPVIEWEYGIAKTWPEELPKVDPGEQEDTPCSGGST